MAILGLMTTSALEANRALNARRKVFYDYPTGRFPLMGLLSLTDDMEQLTDPEFGWHEEQWKSVRSKTIACESGKGPFATNAGAGSGTAAAEATVAAGGTVYLTIVDSSEFRVRDIVNVRDVAYASGSNKAQLVGWVTANDVSKNLLTLQVMDSAFGTTAAENSDTTNNGKYISVIGTASAEGDRSRSDGRTGLPIKITNYTQIFRTVVGPFTGTSLKMGQTFDSKPLYRKSVKDNSLRHMEKMEKAMMFGVARTTTTTNADGDTVPVRFTGGIRHYLQQWDLGNTINGGLFNYRPGGDDLTNVDWTNDAYSEKRVYNNIGTITSDQWEELIRRAFMSQSDTTYQKLVVCGDKVLAKINKWVGAKSIANRDLTSKEDAYGLQIKEVHTVHGDFLFKTHPLFKEDPALQDSMMILDFGDLGYHCLEGRDTELLTNRQPQDADYRKDEWLTECGFEVRMPKRHMFITGLTGILT